MLNGLKYRLMLELLEIFETKNSTHTIYWPTKKSCKGIFCRCKNQKYLQIWLLSRFPIVSEKCKIYRPLKHQERLKNSFVLKTRLSVDAKMKRILSSHLRSWINFIFVVFLLFKIHGYFTDHKLKLKVLKCFVKNRG